MIATSPDLVGREEELATVVAFLDATEALPGVLLLEGEPGIGKTTLWRAGIAAARESSFRVLVARPAEAEVALSYAALADLFGGHLDDVLGGLPEPQRRALEVVLLLAEPAGSPPDQRAIGAGLLNALRLLAGEGPLLLAVDDIAWLDPASSAALEFVARRLHDEPIGWLLTSRDDPRLPLGLERAPPEVRISSLRVGPLGIDCLYRVVHKELGAVFSRLTLRRIHEAARGNPLFALELARGLERRGRGFEPGEPMPVPERIHDLVGDRIAALPIETVNVLGMVAALSRPTIGVVAEASGGPASALEPAVQGGVIELDGDRIRFTHPLLAWAAYSEIAADRRRELHRRLAGVVSEPEERARHLALAADGPDEETAAALDEAAVRAASRGAPAEAAELAELAAKLTPAASIEAGWRRLIASADHHATAGQPARVQSILEPLVKAMPAGSERARALFLLGWSDTLSGQGEARYEQALSEVGQEDTLSARIHRRLGFARAYAGDLASARSHAEVALDRSTRAGDPLALTKSFSLLLLLDALAGRPVSSSRLEQALALGRGIDACFYYEPNVVCAVLLTSFDRLDEARSMLTEAYRTATDHGNEEVSSTTLLHLARLECRAGNWAQAAELARRGHELTQQQGLGDRRGVLLCARALVAAHQGRKEARALAEEAASNLEASGNVLWEVESRTVLGFYELSRGNAAAAVQVLEPLPPRLRTGGFGEPGLLQALPNLIEALAELGDLEPAQPLVRWLEWQGRLLDSPLALSQAARCRGLLAAAGGDLVTALACFDAALVEHRRMGGPFERGRTLLALGSVQRRARQRRASRESLQQALAIFEELGAALWAARARAELARIGGRSASPGDLTPAERRVVELVAQGKTNREVAAELVISVRTVESSLTKAYRKLGVRSRSELARRLASQ